MTLSNLDHRETEFWRSAFPKSNLGTRQKLFLAPGRPIQRLANIRTEAGGRIDHVKRLSA